MPAATPLGSAASAEASLDLSGKVSTWPEPTDAAGSSVSRSCVFLLFRAFPARVPRLRLFAWSFRAAFASIESRASSVACWRPSGGATSCIQDSICFLKRASFEREQTAAKRRTLISCANSRMVSRRAASASYSTRSSAVLPRVVQPEGFPEQGTLTGHGRTEIFPPGLDQAARSRSWLPTCQKCRALECLGAGWLGGWLTKGECPCG